jgi:hypothetical protein
MFKVYEMLKAQAEAKAAEIEITEYTATENKQYVYG